MTGLIYIVKTRSSSKGLRALIILNSPGTIRKTSHLFKFWMFKKMSEMVIPEKQIKFCAYFCKCLFHIEKDPQRVMVDPEQLIV